jgi:hypothetical protein
MKDTFVKLRSEAPVKARWQRVARDHSQSLTEFVVTAVEAAIVGRIDQASLDEHLRAIRADSNAAHEATTIEEARKHIDIIRQRVAKLRGMES